MNRKINRYKKVAVSIFTAVFLLVQSPLVYGQVPTPPPPPENDYVEPTPPPEPTPPAEPSPPPPAPTPPDAPTLDDVLNPSPTPTPEPEGGEVVASESDGSDSGGNTSGSSGDTQSESSGESNPHSGTVADGQSGETEIETGDADSSATIVNDVNNNISTVTPSGNGSGGITVINDENGSESDNSGSVSVVDDTTTIQDNSAKVVNNLTEESDSGDNSASKNMGDSSIDTGDANTSGTIINSVNNNIDGVMVAEFNVVDDQMGDLILDFSDGCISGCGGGDIAVENTGNGSDSINNGEVDSVANNNTFQNNDADLENNMTLESDSGDNTADKNTGGDSSIETGDANVAANILNFANNNLAGNVIYTVVNIFGDLIGDIIFPDGACCFGSATAENSGNGSESENTASIDQTTNDNTFQFNDVNIENNLVFDAETGENETSKNTGGDSSIETGDASINAQVINVANTNILGGDWWLVIVNEAGQWIGKILGAPDGATLAGSDGFIFEVDEYGEIRVVNADNGEGSQNSGSVTSETNNTTVQTNTANIVNNINLSANTGGNSASKNTGGDSSIKTGDANIIANIVNFVNTNIVGDGRLFVNVINVFGSWVGDFISPGHTKEVQDVASQGNEPAVGGTNLSYDNSGGDSSNGGSSESVSDDSSGAEPTPVFTGTSGVLASASLVGVESAVIGDSQGGFGSGGNSALMSSEDNAININLAWLLLLIPGYLVVIIGKKTFALLPTRGG